MTDKLVANILEGCPYSENAEKLLNKYNANYTKVPVNYFNKSNEKFKIMKTFPQIYLESKNGKKHVMGGFNELDNFYKRYEETDRKQPLKILDSLSYISNKKSILLKLALNLLNGIK